MAFWNWGSSSKQESYAHEEAAEITHKDEGPEPQLSSSKKEETSPKGQYHHRSADPAGAASPPVT